MLIVISCSSINKDSNIQKECRKYSYVLTFLDVFLKQSDNLEQLDSIANNHKIVLGKNVKKIIDKELNTLSYELSTFYQNHPEEITIKWFNCYEGKASIAPWYSNMYMIIEIMYEIPIKNSKIGVLFIQPNKDDKLIFFDISISKLKYPKIKPGESLIPPD
jgi:cold shock CspA family protein